MKVKTHQIELRDWKRSYEKFFGGIEFDYKFDHEEGFRVQ